MEKNQEIITYIGIIALISLLIIVIMYVIFTANNIVFEWFWVMMIGLSLDCLGVVLILTPIIKFDLSRYEQVKSNFEVSQIMHEMMKKNQQFNPHKLVTQVDLALNHVVLTRTIFEIYQDAKKNKKYAYIGSCILISGFILIMIGNILQS